MVPWRRCRRTGVAKPRAGPADEVVDAAAVDLLRLGDRDDVGQTGVFQETAEAGVLAVGGICGDPGEGERGVKGPQDHGAGEVVLGGEVPLVGDPGCSAALPVFGPGLGQIELAVDQGVPACGGVGGEGTDLAVLGPARGSGILPLHPGRGGALLDEAGVIDDQLTLRCAELLCCIGLQVIAETVGVPAAVGQQVLESVRGGMASVLSKLPAVLAAYRSSPRT